MSLKIIFMGTPEFAVPVLKSINKSKHNLLAVYTQPPKKKLRGQKIIASPIQVCAEELNIPVRSPDNLNSDIEYNFLTKLKPNIVIVVAYGKMIPKKFLDLPGIHFINIHASLLPKWRGAAPIQRAIMNMDKETGISIMKIENKLDAGPVMQYFKIKITNECNYESLSKKMSSLAALKIIDSLATLQKNNQKFISQDNSKATYAKKINKEESKIDWQDDANQVVAKINALNPNPGSWLNLTGSRIKILKAKVVNRSGKPGEIIDENFTVACANNSVQILELKKEGKKSMNTSDFIRGNKLKVGTILNGA